MSAANNQITAPRVDLIDEKTGKIRREWYMFLYNLYTITGSGSGITPIINGGTGLSTLPTNGQLLIGDEGAYTLNTLGAGTGVSVTNGPGTIVVANTGVLSNIAGAGISVSGATGNVTIANTGVLSFSGGTTGLTPVAAAVGAVVLGGTLNAVNGGTGQSSYTIGDLLYADTATTLAKLADVATGNALISGGVTTAPAWGKIGLTTHVSGTLGIANGGTNGTTTPTAGAVPYGTGTAYAFSAVGTSGQVLTSAGAGTPTWTTPTTGTVTSVTGTAPVVSSGGNTPAISLAAAYGDTLNPYAAKTANYVLAGPTTGAAAAPTFRALVATDIPSLSYVTSVSGTTGRITSTGGTTPVIDLASGVATAGTTGSSLLIPVVTIDTYGRVTTITTASNPQGTVTSVAALTLGTTGTDLSSSVATGTTTPVITLNVPTASATNRGALSAADWTTFNNKGSGSVTSVSFTGGIISVATATTTPALTVAGTSGGIPYFASGTTWASSAALTQYGVVYGGGAGATPVATAAGTTGQVLTATTGGAPTWAAPATSGTVTSVSVVSANGFAGTVATSTTTPAITLTTTITGLLKGNGTAISAAVANTDYVPLSTVLTKTADYTITNTDTWIINNKTGSALTLTFPAASAWTGRYITVKNMQAQLVNSASSNIVPIDSTTAGTAILLAVVGNWATMVSDGTNWVIMQAASNNNLLLE